MNLSEQAAGWLVRLNDSDCTEADRREFEAWLAADESHRAEYRQFERLWQTLDRLPARSPRARPATLWLAVGILATLLALAPPTEQQLINTGIGERRHLVLADGSELDVNAHSRVRTDFSWFSRRIEVESGEALFKVAPDKLRIFEVRAGNSLMRDIGTTFDVSNENGKVAAFVIEGSVRVRLDGHARGVVLNGGEQLSYGPDGELRERRLDADAAAAWRNGRFIFKNTPLDDVIAGMNRQHPRRIELADPALARLHVSGAFNIEDRTGLLRALETLYSLRATDEGDVTRLVRAQ